MRKQRIRQLGFTLLEMVLVLVIFSSVIYMIIGYLQRQTLENQFSRSSIQMQQIMAAAASYYVVKNKWPADIATMQTDGYIPSGLTIRSPWGGTSYRVLNNTRSFFVGVTISQATNAKALAYANMLAGRLPVAIVTGTNPATTSPGTTPVQSACVGTTCYVIAQIGIPPQNLNKSLSVNFAGLYHHGGCVPVPECKVDAGGNTMTAQVYIVPVSVSGIPESNVPPANPNVYPISSFTGYAVGPGNPPLGCNNSTTEGSCGVSPTNSFWRACVNIVTQRGLVGPPVNTSQWGQYVTVAAFTRCVPNSTPYEPQGEVMSVYSG